MIMLMMMNDNEDPADENGDVTDVGLLAGRLAIAIASDGCGVAY